MNSITLSTPYRLWSIDFLKAYGITMRPYLCFLSGITGLAGAAIASSSNTTTSQIVLLGIASFLSYGFGQALTDCFQIDTDSLSSPYRPLTQGRITRQQVITISVLGLGLCTGIFALYSVYSLALGCIAALGLVSYTYFKRRYWGGPLYNALIVCCLCGMGVLATSHDLALVDKRELTLLLLAVGFGYANFVLSGYFKDVEADRATGYDTLLVHSGRRVSSFVSDVFALGLSIASTVLVRDAVSLSNSLASLVPAFIYVAAGLIVTIIAQVRLHAVRRDDDAFTPILLVVHSYILMLSAWCLLRHPSWTFFITLFYLAFHLTVSRRPSREQI